ncbi:MAG: hypothetical protein ACI4QH_03010 [Candidatus Fimimonas sp.]
MKNASFTNTSTLKHAVVILVLLVVLGASLLVYFNRTLGWFADNRNVSASGAEVTLAQYGIEGTYFAKGANEAEFSQKDGDFGFGGIAPGQQVSMQARYVNNSTETRTLSVYLGLLANEVETPLVLDDKYYYLSTQLKIVAISVNGQSVQENKFLMTPPTDKLAYDAEQTVENVLVAQFDLLASQTVTVEVTVEFVNYADVDQNVYQGFGNGTENCFRKFIAFIEK